MSSISSVQEGQASQKYYSSLLSSLVPLAAAGGAIGLALPDLIAKSAQQRGEPIPKITAAQVIKLWPKMALSVGSIVGIQMLLQKRIENALSEESNKPSLSTTFVSSIIIGPVSAFPIAIFNGQAMGWSVSESLRKFSVKQGLVISGQETAFVGGLAAAKPLATFMKEQLGDNKVVEYSAAFLSGGAGSFAGHGFNTALTRWQSGMQVESLQQLTWGAFRKTRGIACFALGFKVIKDSLDSYIENPKN